MHTWYVFRYQILGIGVESYVACSIKNWADVVTIFSLRTRQGSKALWYEYGIVVFCTININVPGGLVGYSRAY